MNGICNISSTLCTLFSQRKKCEEFSCQGHLKILFHFKEKEYYPHPVKRRKYNYNIKHAHQQNQIDSDHNMTYFFSQNINTMSFFLI